MKQKSTWVLTFLFAVGVIVVYKTVDNFNFVFDYAGKIMGALSPFITGFVIAYLLNLPIKRFQGVVEKANVAFVRKRAKGIAITAVYALVIVILTVFLRIIIPAIYQNIMDLYYNVPHYLESMVQKIVEFQERFDIDIISFDKQGTIDTMQSFLKNINLAEFGKYAQGVINATSGIISGFIAVIISIYMLSDKAIIAAGIKRILNAFLPSDRVEEFVDFAAKTNDIFSKYIFSIVADGLLVGILSAIIMSLLKVKYAAVLGLMIGIFSLIPYFGAIVAVTLAIIITLLTGGFFKGLWTAVALFVLQQIDGNYIGPKIMGNMLEARPLLIIFAVTLGGGLFGVPGMVLSVPVVMVVKMLLEELIKSREAKKAAENG